MLLWYAPQRLGLSLAGGHHVASDDAPDTATKQTVMGCIVAVIVAVAVQGRAAPAEDAPIPVTPTPTEESAHGRGRP